MHNLERRIKKLEQIIAPTARGFVIFGDEPRPADAKENDIVLRVRFVDTPKYEETDK